MPLSEDKNQKLSQLITEWVRNSSGWFQASDIDRELGIEETPTKNNRRVILHRLCDQGLLKRHSTRNAVFRLVSEAAPILDWQQADVGNTVNVVWPFGLEKLVSIYPKNIIVIAGTFNAGKTAFCLNFVARNIGKFPIDYYTSEMGAEELKVRLTKFETEFPPDFARERTHGFADVVDPDRISVIDYLEITDNFYLVAEELAEIFNKLNKGIAIVAIQKKRGAEFGRGAEFSLEKPRLYLSMDNNLLKIIKAKNWKDAGKNPNGLQWSFKLLDGHKFIDIMEKF